MATAATLATAAPGCRLETQSAPATAEATAPGFSLATHDGRTVSLDELVARGPAILVFYRGYW
ncbi:MAG: hypothetical protein AAGF11_10465 [Myxococcota bacterium]